MNVSSVKNLNGETFSAVQDADLTTVVQSNSGEWDRISALSGYSANGWQVKLKSGPSIIASPVAMTASGIPPITGYLTVSAGGKKWVSISDGSITIYNSNHGVSAQRIRTIDILKWNNYGSAKLDTSAFSSVSGEWYDTISSYQNASANYLTAVNIPESANWNDTTNVVQTNSSTWGQGGGSVDTIPFVVNSPLTTGFTGTSAYIGLDSTAIDMSPYVPYSALGDDYDGKVHTINGSAIYAEHANESQRAQDDSNGDWIAGTYQKISAMSDYQTSLTFGGSDNTLTAINGSAIGGSMESFELSAGNNISIVDDIATSATIISVSGISASDWNDTTDVVQSNSASWSSTPTYAYTDGNLISAINTSGLYATSAYVARYANSVVNGGRLGIDVSAVTGDGDGNTLMILNPNTTPFGNTSGIYNPLYYAKGACMTYGSSAGNTQYFGGFFKGNEWYVSNATAGQALRGETHASRGVHISGATTAGNSFDLSTSAVSGKNDTANGYNWKLERGCVSGKGINGEWRYGPAEDSALRTVSALPQINFVSTSSEATGTNILYVVTGAGA